MAETLVFSDPFTPSQLYRFAPESISIRAEQILKIQGYSDLAKVRRPIKAAASKLAKLVEQIAQPEVVFKKIEVAKLDPTTLTTANEITFYGDVFAKYLNKCDEIIVFVITAGQSLDDEAERLRIEENLLEALFLENAGWMAIESITKSFNQYLKKQLNEHNQTVTRRLGPGYSYGSETNRSYWGLEDQVNLFAVFAEDDIPVNILESGAMLPRMSRSGLYGARKTLVD